MNFINFEQIYQHFNPNQFYFDKIDFIGKAYNMESIKNNDINKFDVCSICLEKLLNSGKLMELTECKVFCINK